MSFLYRSTAVYTKKFREYYQGPISIFFGLSKVERDIRNDTGSDFPGIFHVLAGAGRDNAAR